jgi:hypothetical protein
MALRTIDLDPEILARALRQLPRLIRWPGFGDRLLGKVDSLTVSLAVPQPVYVLGLAELVRGAGLGQARRIAVQLLLLDGDDPFAGVEVRDHGSGLQLHRGPYAAATARAIERAEPRPELAGAEVRLLRVSALHFRALWLHGGAGVPDLLTPLRPAPVPIVADRDYAPGELLPLLAELAQQNLAGLGDETGS